mgnify:CR=1 FL=1
MKSNTVIKKALHFFLAAVLAASVLSLPLSANAASVSLSVSSKTADSGDDVVISINISGNSGLAAATFLLKYDHTKLAYKSNSPGSAAAGGMSSVNPEFNTEGDFTTINDSFISLSEISAEGSMLNVTFTVKSGWSGTTPLTLTTTTFAGGDYKEIAKTISNGSVKVSGSSTATTTEPAATTKPATTNPVTTTKPASTTSPVTTTKPALTTSLATTTKPVSTTYMVTTKPATVTTKPVTVINATEALSTTSPSAAATTKAVSATTAVPVTEKIKVRQDDVSKAAENAGITKWSGDVSDLTPSQKADVKTNLEENGKEVEVKDDGFYYVETVATSAAVSESGVNTTQAGTSAENDGKSASPKTIGFIVIIAAVVAVLAAAAVILLKRKK